LILPRDEALVNRVRAALRQYSRLEQTYARLKSDGNAKLKPFTLDLATAGKTEYLASTRAVPGVFTDVGWHTYFKDAIGQASKNVVQNDWILGTDAGSSGVQTLESGYEDKLREWYFAEYAEEWSRFLEAISVRPFTDIMDAKNAMDLFSQQDASLARLLQNVASNTLLRREQKRAEPGAAPGAPAILQRPTRSELIEAVADKFSPLHEVAASLDGKIAPQTAQYFDALGRIRSQLQNLLEAGAQGEMIRNYATRVSGSASGDEFREAYRIAQRVRQTCSANRFTNPVGALLEQPIRLAWAALIRDMMGNLDIRWKTQITDLYRREVESQYPFNPNGQDLPLNLLAKYFKSGDGLIWAFYEKELRALMPSDVAGPAAFFTLKPTFTKDALDFLERAKTIRDAFYSTGGTEPLVFFDLTPEGGVDITESILEIDGQPQLRYRNEAQSPQNFSWPGKPGPPQARISIAITSSTERPTLPTINGDWAFFRLLQKANVEMLSANSYRINWTVPSTDPRKFILRYRLQARNATNPFAPGFFRDMRCPDKLLQSGGMAGLP
jgi:type VI secretion system protein ImpL